MTTKGRDRYGCYAVLLLMGLIALTLLSNSLPLAFAAGCWCGIILLLRRLIPAVHVPGRLRLRGLVLSYAAMGAVFYLAAHFVIGAILKMLAASPYDNSVMGILYNLVRILPPLVARELIRAYSLGAAWRVCKYKRAAFVAITLVFFVTDLHYGRLLQIDDAQSAVIYAAQLAAPALARSVLLSLLVFYGGAGAGITYAAIPEVFQRVFPFLPDLPWLAQSAIGACFPLVFALLTSERFHAENRDVVVRKSGGTASFAAGLLAAVMFSWFMVGVFPVYPSVVLTGSMEPLIIPGDMVLIYKLRDESEIYRLREGDIINFKRGDITITHRITSIRKDEAGNLTFETKGDNNDAADEQYVQPNDINGTIRHIVPKVGLPILIIRSGQKVPEGVTDYA